MCAQGSRFEPQHPQANVPRISAREATLRSVKRLEEEKAQNPWTPRPAEPPRAARRWRRTRKSRWRGCVGRLRRPPSPARAKTSRPAHFTFV